MRQQPPRSPSDPIRRSFAAKISAKDKGKVILPRKIVLDWRAYFYNFCREHGEPIQYHNVLLFRDGWRYGMEYEGPEYPPPADHRELDILVMKYWLGRLRVCNQALVKVITERDRIVLFTANHSMELQQTVYVDHGDRRQKASVPLDLTPLDEKIKWYRADVRECEDMLAEIEEFHRNAKDK